MIGYLSGKILEIAEGRAMIGVGPEGACVGYAVALPQSAAQAALVPGQVVELFIHTHVREDAFDLYAFLTRMEKDLFLTLLNVNGIGPKGALNILSGAEVDQLVHAILDEDKNFLTKVPGIGKKTAERIVLELADPIRKKMEAGLLPARSTSIGAQGMPVRNAGATAASRHPIFRDALSGLTGLGYREPDALVALERMWNEMDAPPEKVEDVIRLALRQL